MTPEVTTTIENASPTLRAQTSLYRPSCQNNLSHTTRNGCRDQSSKRQKPHTRTPHPHRKDHTATAHKTYTVKAKNTYTSHETPHPHFSGVRDTPTSHTKHYPRTQRPHTNTRVSRNSCLVTSGKRQKPNRKHLHHTTKRHATAAEVE